MLVMKSFAIIFSFALICCSLIVGVYCSDNFLFDSISLTTIGIVVFMLSFFIVRVLSFIVNFAVGVYVML